MLDSFKKKMGLVGPQGDAAAKKSPDEQNDKAKNKKESAKQKKEITESAKSVPNLPKITKKQPKQIENVQKYGDNSLVFNVPQGETSEHLIKFSMTKMRSMSEEPIVMPIGTNSEKIKIQSDLQMFDSESYMRPNFKLRQNADFFATPSPDYPPRSQMPKQISEYNTQSPHPNGYYAFTERMKKANVQKNSNFHLQVQSTSPTKYQNDPEWRHLIDQSDYLDEQFQRYKISKTKIDMYSKNNEPSNQAYKKSQHILLDQVMEEPLSVKSAKMKPNFNKIYFKKVDRIEEKDHEKTDQQQQLQKLIDEQKAKIRALEKHVDKQRRKEAESRNSKMSQRASSILKSKSILVNSRNQNHKSELNSKQKWIYHTNGDNQEISDMINPRLAAYSDKPQLSTMEYLRKFETKDEFTGQSLLKPYPRHNSLQTLKKKNKNTKDYEITAMMNRMKQAQSGKRVPYISKKKQGELVLPLLNTKKLQSYI